MQNLKQNLKLTIKGTNCVKPESNQTVFPEGGSCP